MEKSVISGGHSSDPEMDPLVQEEEEDSEITFARGTASTRTGARRRGLEHSYGSGFDPEPDTPSAFQKESTRVQSSTTSSSRAATGGRAAAEDGDQLLEEYMDEAWDLVQRGFSAKMVLNFLRKLDQERKSKSASRKLFKEEEEEDEELDTPPPKSRNAALEPKRRISVMAPLTPMERQAHAVKEKIIPAVRDVGETLGKEIPTTSSALAGLADTDWLRDYYDETKWDSSRKKLACRSAEKLQPPAWEAKKGQQYGEAYFWWTNAEYWAITISMGHIDQAWLVLRRLFPGREAPFFEATLRMALITHPRDQFKAWEFFRVQFLNKYETQRSYLKTEEHFDQLKQREEDSVDNWGVYLQNAAYRLGRLDKSQETVLIKKFINGLAGPIKARMIADPRGYPQSFRQAMEFAQDHEDVMKADKIYSGQHKGDRSSGNKYKTDRAPNSKSFVPKSAQDQKEEPKTAPKAQAPKLSTEERQSLSQEGKCFYCKEKGHRAAECPKKKNRPSQGASDYSKVVPLHHMRGEV